MVTQIQDMLRRHGENPGKRDQYYGPKMAAAVERFKQKHNIHEDGIGAQTLAKLSGKSAPAATPGRSEGSPLDRVGAPGSGTGPLDRVGGATGSPLDFVGAPGSGGGARTGSPGSRATGGREGSPLDFVGVRSESPLDRIGGAAASPLDLVGG
jgi:peptidoglycan hydrolase-like protein with peptidoglycan-binding domain